MDNVTHALAGLLLAEAVVLSAARGAAPNAAFRRRAWFLSALANNLPDFDFVYRRITEGPVGYLLHHRGHTHTLLVALLLGLLTFFAATALERPKRAAPERRVLLALCLAGPWIHIGMDFFNNYGVHPFWPFDNDWFYGDSIFIIEPWFLVFSVPPLFFAAEQRWGKALLAVALGAGVGLAWWIPLVGAGTAFTLSSGAVLWFWWCRSRAAKWRALASLFACVLLLFTFVVAGRIARARVLATQEGTGASHLDAVLTPAPSNPLCWSAITVAERNARYELRVATLSLAPALVTPEGCRFEPSGQSLPPSTERFGSGSGAREHSAGAAVGPSPPGLRWDLAWNAPLSELGSLYRSNCQAAAFLRYARVPYFFPKEPGSVYLGDLRYDRRPEVEFAELEVPDKPSRCPNFVPPWRPPRHELLETR